ncbi:MAG: ABC transporter permease [Lachnospiraceae bacterium]|nr:ABC transporter permease [Lachnospiraceae bacterium]
MVRYLIKNYIKMMLRSPLTILIYILGPTVVAAVLISAFTNLMKTYEGVDTFEVGYTIEEGSVFEAGIETLIDTFDENGIKFTLYMNEQPEEAIERKQLAGFVSFGKNDYTIYETKDTRAQGHILEYMLENTFETATDTALMAAAIMSTAQAGTCETTNAGTLQGGTQGTTNAGMLQVGGHITTEYPEYIPAIDSTDYYGIIEIVYFSAIAIVCGAAFFSNEKKNRIDRKLRVSNISGAKVYLAKLISITIAVSIGILAATLVLTALMGVRWGNALLSAGIVFMLILGTLAMELFILEVTNSMAATVIITFAIVWLMGFVGGSFETYMFSNHSQTLKNLSPIYYANRSLVELSCMGQSDFVPITLMVSTGMCIVFSALAVTAGKIRRTRT